jgi:hypothetical protein
MRRADKVCQDVKTDSVALELVLEVSKIDSPLVSMTVGPKCLPRWLIPSVHPRLSPPLPATRLAKTSSAAGPVIRKLLSC